MEEITLNSERISKAHKSWGQKKQLRESFILKMSSKSFEENIQLQDYHLFFSVLLVLRWGDSCSLTHSVLSIVLTRIFLFKDCGFLEEITKQSCGLTHFTLYLETISCLQNNTSPMYHLSHHNGLRE
ncbi:transmembrane protein 189 [Platysternon megacephalum]|uniref:Transmembrane protein 189 n=1 Tax=Platysternon megacephalum TaxID=55544 RepID=A0A4D9EM32_9SAUR|nr:transmembrane protein 189 [Platysternon megacephalum]